MNWFVLALKKYAQFQGRSRRSEFWYFALFHLLIALVVIVPAVIFVVIGASSHNSIVTGLGVVLYLAYFAFSLALLVPSLAVTVRRLHDTGRSGWWYFIGLIPFVGGIVLLVFLCSDSQPGDNLYGPNPKGIGPWGLATYPPPANADLG